MISSFQVHGKPRRWSRAQSRTGSVSADLRPGLRTTGWLPRMSERRITEQDILFRLRTGHRKRHTYKKFHQTKIDAEQEQGPLRIYYRSICSMLTSDCGDGSTSVGIKLFDN
ncbi:hypothetical protein PoB_002433500 [Plakobranchus ocellatus]|uniref:Uncharacterized protein n=1 Tax=Plakobranchus ocellatus TaxID=259542 RepID=A0AAV3ZRQ1_9GAST|nr:hypothetical protein PoB_002433500 [Plakobranchus ocellatus]